MERDSNLTENDLNRVLECIDELLLAIKDMHSVCMQYNHNLQCRLFARALDGMLEQVGLNADEFIRLRDEAKTS